MKTASRKFVLVYGNPLPASRAERSLPVEANCEQEAVIRVLGGCDEISGTSYKVGKLFGTVEEVA